MKSRKLTTLAGIALALLLVLGVGSNVSAQGRGNGGGRPGGNPGNGGGGGRPVGNPGVDRGIDMSSERSNGRSDRGRDTARDRSNGRSDEGIERARSGRENARRSNDNVPGDNELNRYRGISRRLNTTPEQLRSQYEAALAANPNLKFGQFVAANMIADNLSSRYPNVTTSAILLGLQIGDSIGETLRELGVSSSDAKDIEKRAKREIKASKNQN
ncbi:MAG: hypothetical protein M3525_15565 [Acidobacteriota bacterium]|nr:hypothetical protein [Acidobacteriota bacterium]